MCHDDSMIDEWEIQFGLIFDCVRASVYGNYISEQKPQKDSAWWGLRDSCYLDAVISWTQLFGTNNEETHWKKFVSRVSIPTGEPLMPFNKDLILVNLKISNAEWCQYHRQMLDFRNTRLSHLNMNHEMVNYPKLTYAVDSAMLYRHWLIEALKVGKRHGYVQADLKISTDKKRVIIMDFNNKIAEAFKRELQ